MKISISPQIYLFATFLQSKVRPIVEAADDTAAEAAGVEIGGFYHNNGDLKVRLHNYPVAANDAEAAAAGVEIDGLYVLNGVITPRLV